MKVFSSLLASMSLAVNVYAAVLTDGHVIVMPENPLPAERTAANELKMYLKESSGIDCSIVTGNPGAAVPAFYLGKAASGVELFAGSVLEELEDEEILVKTSPDGSVLLAGGGERGTLYAVYTFLEEAAGVRWLAPDCTVVPPAEVLEIPALNIRYRSPISVRSSDAAMFLPQSGNVFAARSRINGNSAPASHGGNVNMKRLGGAHSFERLVPDKWFYENNRDWFTDDFIIPSGNPELYALVDGRRVSGGGGQLCLTNPEVRKIVVHNASALIKWKKPHTTSYCVSQNDNQNFCRCPDCEAMAAELGSQTDLLLWFLNGVIEDLDKEFPGIQIETLAYQYTLPPPVSVIPHPNIRIRVCLIEAGTRAPFFAPENEAFRRIVEGWTQVSDNVSLWHYVPNFSNLGLLHPNFNSYQPNYSWFAEKGIKDVFSEDTAPGGSFGFFPELRAYLCAKLLWNPGLDPDVLKKEFIDGYYGKAAPYIAEYLSLYEDLLAAAPWAYLDCYELDTLKWCPYEALEYGSSLLDDAANAAAGDDAVASRVEILRTAHDWTILWRTENTPLRDFYRLAPVPGFASLRNGIEERLNNVAKTPGSRELFTHLGKNITQGLAALDNQLGTPWTPVQIPAELQYVPEDSLAMLNCDYIVSGTAVIKDHLAPQQQAKRLAMGNYNLAARITLPGTDEPFRVSAYAEVRLPQAVTNASGTAFICGYYFYGTNFGQMTRTYIDASELSNKGYALIPIGTIDTEFDQQIYFQGVNNPTVPEILVSRVWLVRE